VAPTIARGQHIFLREDEGRGPIGRVHRGTSLLRKRKKSNESGSLPQRFRVKGDGGASNSKKKGSGRRVKER